MRPGGAGRLHLELVFFFKALTQIQPSLLIQAPVFKNVYTVYRNRRYEEEIVMLMSHREGEQRMVETSKQKTQIQGTEDMKRR